MVDYREIIDGSRYATIFGRMEAGKGLMTAAQSFVSIALENIGSLETKKLSADEQTDAVEPMVGTPITMVMASITSMEDVEEVVVEMPDYDANSEILNSELQSFLNELGVFDSIKIDMTQNLKEHLLANWIAEGMTNSEHLAVREEINVLVSSLGNTPEFENYVGHCIMSTLSALQKEQLEDMGGFEDLGAEDPKPLKDVTGEFDPSNVDAWKDSMREFKSLDWKDIMRK